MVIDIFIEQVMTVQVYHAVAYGMPSNESMNIVTILASQNYTWASY